MSLKRETQKGNRLGVFDNKRRVIQEGPEGRGNGCGKTPSTEYPHCSLTILDLLSGPYY